MLELLESLRADQFDRWRAGERVTAETYLDRNPTVRDDPEAAVDLIYSEILLREEMGEAVAFDEYLTHYPRYAAALERQLQLHDLFRPDLVGRPSADNRTTPYPLTTDLRIPIDRQRTLAAGAPYRGSEGGLAADDPARWPTIPGFQLEARLGSGGGGIVYRARQLSLDRTVAVKVLHTLEVPQPEELALFRNEAGAVARLRHPNVVQIHELGDVQGHPFIVMEYVAGGGLDRKLAEKRPLPPNEAAVLVATLARAVHAVHGEKIIHRDLKPGNILIGADSVPKIADFGLAKRVGADVSLIQTGAVVGTPAYMAPEQACGRSRDVGPATDVYALGAILYETLTGQAPFKGDSLLDTLARVKNRPPVAPRRLDRTLPADLESICLKCLEKNPRDRYATAEALAEDLERYSRGEPRVRPAWPVRLIHRIRRRRWLVALGVLVTAAAMGLAFGGYVVLQNDPEKDIRRTVAEQGRYTFIGAKGQPKLMAWPVNQGAVAQVADANDPFAYKSVDCCPLQLLSAPGPEHYLFRAKVRHDHDGRGGTAGIFFGLSKSSTTDGDVFCFCTLTFNDLTDLDPKGPPGKMHNPVQCQICVLRQAGTIDRRQTVGNPTLITPAFVADKTKPFRDLAVEITSSAVRVFWERELVGEVTHVELSTTAQTLRDAEPKLAGVEVQFRPTGGFGLFLQDGVASFIDAALETPTGK